MKLFGLVGRAPLAAGIVALCVVPVAALADPGKHNPSPPKSSPAGVTSPTGPTAPNSGSSAPSTPATTGRGTTTSSTPSSSTACAAPQLERPFTGIGDNNWYVLAPGQDANDFTGAGWRLTGGATIVATTLANGIRGSALSLPSGASATSPVMCVAADYPTARMVVRDVSGAPGQGVGFAVSYLGTASEATPRVTGKAHVPPTGWYASKTVNVEPSSATGWQPVRFVLSAAGTRTAFQVYNLYIDPRMMGA